MKALASQGGIMVKEPGYEYGEKNLQFMLSYNRKQGLLF